MYGQPLDLNVDPGVQQRLYDDFRLQAEIEVAESRNRMRRLKNKYAALTQEAQASMDTMRLLLRAEDQKDRDDMIRRLEKIREEDFVEKIKQLQLEAKEAGGGTKVINVLTQMREELSKLAEQADANVSPDDSRVSGRAGMNGHVEIVMTVSMVSDGPDVRNMVITRSVSDWMSKVDKSKAFMLSVAGLDGDNVVDLLNSESLELKCTSMETCDATESQVRNVHEMMSVLSQTLAQSGKYVPVVRIVAPARKNVLLVVPYAVPSETETPANIRNRLLVAKVRGFIGSYFSGPSTSISVFTLDGKRRPGDNKLIAEVANLMAEFAR